MTRQLGEKETGSDIDNIEIKSKEETGRKRERERERERERQRKNMTLCNKYISVTYRTMEFIPATYLHKY